MLRLAVGADSVMVGSLFAGTDENPETSLYMKVENIKHIGMGSVEAITKDRYFGKMKNLKVSPEGIRKSSL